MNQGTRITNPTLKIPHIPIRRAVVFGSLIMVALVAFEIFNFSTTEYALRDIIGSLKFIDIPWSTILAIAFCGIDFAGLARLFTPEVGAEEPREVWYLFGAWMLAAIMNAMLTWWGVSVAIYHHNIIGNGLVARSTLLHVVPVFVAIMVWLIRVLIIGTFSVTGDRLFGKRSKTNGVSQSYRSQTWQSYPRTQAARSLANQPVNSNQSASISRSDYGSRPTMGQRPVQQSLNMGYHPAPRTTQNTPSEHESDYEANFLQADPVYVPVGMASNTTGNTNQIHM